MKKQVIFQLLKPITRYVERKMAYLFFFLNKHFTPLAILVLIILGTIFFHITNYLFRYNHADYWNWKSRAITTSFYFALILISLKILIGIM